MHDRIFLFHSGGGWSRGAVDDALDDVKNLVLPGNCHAYLVAHGDLWRSTSN